MKIIQNFERSDVSAYFLRNKNLIAILRNQNHVSFGTGKCQISDLCQNAQLNHDFPIRKKKKTKVHVLYRESTKNDFRSPSFDLKFIIF